MDLNSNRIFCVICRAVLGLLYYNYNNSHSMKINRAVNAFSELTQWAEQLLLISSSIQK